MSALKIYRNKKPLAKKPTGNKHQRQRRDRGLYQNVVHVSVDRSRSTATILLQLIVIALS